MEVGKMNYGIPEVNYGYRDDWKRQMQDDFALLHALLNPNLIAVAREYAKQIGAFAASNRSDSTECYQIRCLFVDALQDAGECGTLPNYAISGEGITIAREIIRLAERVEESK